MEHKHIRLGQTWRYHKFDYKIGEVRESDVSLIYVATGEVANHHFPISRMIGPNSNRWKLISDVGKVEKYVTVKCDCGDSFVLMPEDEWRYKCDDCQAKTNKEKVSG